MRHIVEFMLDDGGSILIEVDEQEDEEGISRVARPGEIAIRASQTFESVIEKIKPTAVAIIAKLRGLTDAPDITSIEFGLKMSAEAGAFVAAVGAQANFKVTLTWKKENSQDEHTT